MKPTIFILFFLLIASCTLVSTTSPPVDITGKWKGELNEVDTHLRFEFQFKSDGKSLVGTARERTRTPKKLMTIEHGKIDGNNIFFIVEPGFKYGGLDVKYRINGEYIGANMINLRLWTLPSTPDSYFQTFTIERVYY